MGSKVTGLGGPREWLVALEPSDGVLPLPTRAAVVLETPEVPAEVWSHHTITHGTERVLQIGVDLNLRGREGRKGGRERRERRRGGMTPHRVEYRHTLLTRVHYGHRPE